MAMTDRILWMATFAFIKPENGLLTIDRGRLAELTHGEKIVVGVLSVSIPRRILPSVIKINAELNPELSPIDFISDMS